MANKTPITTELAQKNKVQTKILSSNVTSDGAISELTFNNLEVGKWYEVDLQAHLNINQGGTDAVVAATIEHNGTPRAAAQVRDNAVEFGAFKVSAKAKFQAESTSVEIVAISASSNSLIIGGGGLDSTYARIEERNDLEETTDFT